MEDSSRDLEKELKKYAVPNLFKRSGKWQMLLISEDGKMISVKRYKDIVLILMILLIVSLLATALFSVLYLRSLKSTVELKSKVAGAEQETKALQEEKERLEAMLFLAEKNIKPEAPAKETVAPQKIETPPAKKEEKKVEPMKAAVKDLTVIKDAQIDETRIRFIVKNDCELQSISGRVFVILKPDSSKPQDWLTMPPVTLKSGAPAMPSRGQFFSINNFKSVNFKFKNPLPDDHYKTMDVFIYSTDGDQIFKKTYTIDLVVINKPKPTPTPKEETEPPVTDDDTTSGETGASSENSTIGTAVNVVPSAETVQAESSDYNTDQGENADAP